MEKTNDGTEDCPNGADEGVNPYGDDDREINGTFSVLPGYEIVSCNNCTNSSISADKTTVTFTIGDDDEFSIVFSKIPEPEPRVLIDPDTVIVRIRRCNIL